MIAALRVYSLQFTMQFFGGKCGRTKPKFSKISKIYQNDNINMDLPSFKLFEVVPAGKIRNSSALVVFRPPHAVVWKKRS